MPKGPSRSSSARARRPTHEGSTNARGRPSNVASIWRRTASPRGPTASASRRAASRCTAGLSPRRGRGAPRRFTAILRASACAHAATRTLCARRTRATHAGRALPLPHASCEPTEDLGPCLQPCLPPCLSIIPPPRGCGGKDDSLALLPALAFGVAVRRRRREVLERFADRLPSDVVEHLRRKCTRNFENRTDRGRTPSGVAGRTSRLPVGDHRLTIRRILSP